MGEIDLPEEIQRLAALYKHYRKLYHRVRFLCCSDQAFHAKEQKDYYKDLLQKAREKGIEVD